MKEKKNQWDEKARNYNRYSPDNSRFEAKVIHKIEELGIDFSQKNIIDVGAGTGAYTIRLAKKAHFVVAMDFSSQMLEVLKEDAIKEKVSNLKTQVSSWSDYELEQTFDIAFTTMSPALSNENDFLKFHKCAQTKIYLGWAGQRDSDILQKLFEVHDTFYTPPNGSQELKNWLNSQKIPFTCKEFDELKISTCKDEEGLEKYKWHLEIRDVIPQEKLILNVLKDFSKDGIITETTKNKMNLIIW
jgi:SAM-dependent methyltransferase